MMIRMVGRTRFVPFRSGFEMIELVAFADSQRGQLASFCEGDVYQKVKDFDLIITGLDHRPIRCVREFRSYKNDATRQLY